MRRRGWIMLDMTTGLLLISAMAGILAFGAARQQRNMRALSDIRAAQRVAESALVAMQNGAMAPAGVVTVRELSDSAVAPDRDWVEVTAKVNGRSASLIGLVPRHAVASARPSSGGGL